jgi:glycogen debranching enzyme
MAHHLADFGVGSIAEIFDGDAPFPPRGCVAQAWSVSETLRAWMEIGRGSVEPAAAAPAARRGKSRR